MKIRIYFFCLNKQSDFQYLLPLTEKYLSYEFSEITFLITKRLFSNILHKILVAYN